MTWAILMVFPESSHAQLDSIVKAISDTVINKFIVDDIPKKTFKDKFMYPHRWYIRLLLKPTNSDFDTTYILSSKKKLTITIPVSKKYYGFNLFDHSSSSKLKFLPNNYYHVGFNFSNMFLTFGFVPNIKFGSKEGRGPTKAVDFQLTIIGRRVITDINYQNFKGMYSRDNSESQTIAVRPDIKLISYGVNTMFVFNYKKYSLRGAFSFTDVQRKSSGSLMAGIYHSHVDFTCDDSSFNAPFEPSFSKLIKDMNKITVIVIGLTGGYGYTMVHKKILFSTAINFGAGGQKLNYTLSDRHIQNLPLNMAIHLTAKASLRYDNLRFFVGILATYDNNYSAFVMHFNSSNYMGKAVAFVGYRFNLKNNGRNILKALRLVDYNK
ncbi:MAG: DUF4421 family protein [Burkholderiales bacterium]|nr:DUF4421 family protein [Bacteroidia bacterium]